MCVCVIYMHEEDKIFPSPAISLHAALSQSIFFQPGSFLIPEPPSGEKTNSGDGLWEAVAVLLHSGSGSTTSALMTSMVFISLCLKHVGAPVTEMGISEMDHH